MITYRQILKLAHIGLCLAITMLGCEDARRKKPVDTSQQTEKPPQRLQTRSAPRTLKAFRKAVAAGQVGAIQGVVSFKGIPPKPIETATTFDKHVCGTGPKRSESLLVSDNRQLQNVVVSLLRIPKGLPATVPGQPLQLDQQECVFMPHILIVPVAAEFDVVNSDRVMHNFHAVGTLNKEININQTKTRRRRLKFSYEHPETVKVVCDVHSWMKSWIIVAEHPYYTITDQEGRFRLDNVPEGTYRVKAWHEKLGEQFGETTVTTSQNAIIDFEYRQSQ